jgi:hypothetical protein
MSDFKIRHQVVLIHLLINLQMIIHTSKNIIFFRKIQFIGNQIMYIYSKNFLLFKLANCFTVNNELNKSYNLR